MICIHLFNVEANAGKMQTCQPPPAAVVLFCAQGCQVTSFQTKVPIWEYFGGPWNENVDINSGHLDYFTTIGYM
jgi:hypothetical protein